MSTEPEISDLIDSLQDLSLSQIYPFHCIGDLIREYLETNYPNMYVEVCVGEILLFSEESISSPNTSSTHSFGLLFCLIPLILVTFRSKRS
jgi:hypothetical protein